MDIYIGIVIFAGGYLVGHSLSLLVDGAMVRWRNR